MSNERQLGEEGMAERRVTGPGSTGQLPGTVHLVRHGQSEWNERGLLQGQRADVPLTALGRQQAAAAAAALAGCAATAVVSSDLRRAVETAEPIARRLGVPVQLHCGLREQSVGIYEGRPSREVWAETDPDRWGDPTWRPEGGESLADVADRLFALFEELAGVPSVVLVTHGDTARIALGLLAGHEVTSLPWVALGNGEVRTVQGAGGSRERRSES